MRGSGGIVRHQWARIGLVALIIGGCGREEPSAPAAPSAYESPPPVATFQDMLPDAAALAIAVPKLGTAFANATALLHRLQYPDSADALLLTSTGMQGDAIEWMHAHAIDPDGPAVFLFRVPSAGDASPGAVNAVSIMRAVNPAQFLETIKSAAGPNPLPAETVGDWALLGNDPEFLRAAAAKLEALRKNHGSVQFDADNRWHGAIRPTGIRASLEPYLTQRSKSAPAFLATPLSSFVDSLSDGFADTEPIPFTMKWNDEGILCDVTWVSQTHPALAAWLDEAPHSDGSPDVPREDSGASLTVRLIPSLRSLVTNALHSAALEMNDDDATAAAETLSATLGTIACLRIDGGSVALGWAVTDDERVRELYRATLPSMSSAQPVTYGALTIDTVRVVNPLLVTAGNGIAAIGTGIAAVQDVIDTLHGLQVRRDGAAGGLRFDLQTSVPPPMETVRRVFASEPGEAVAPSGAGPRGA